MADSGTEGGRERPIGVIKVDAEELVREVRALSEKLDQLLCLQRGNEMIVPLRAQEVVLVIDPEKLAERILPFAQTSGEGHGGR